MSGNLKEKWDKNFLWKNPKEFRKIDEEIKYNFIINDRFAITNQETYKIYGKVFDELFEISKKEPLHSETVLTKYLTENDIKYKYIWFVFKRIRQNGSVDPHDRKLRKDIRLG